ncbi:MAG: site-specific integrase, partial [Verrucomicrobia bacterium]|nr:site-specific integrase [Verrucomicrobiota bacterium]
ETSIASQRKTKGPSKSFNRLLQFCDELKADSDSVSLLAHGSDMMVLSEKVDEAISQFQHQISNKPFMALVVSWASDVDAHLASGERLVACILDLIEHGVLPYEDKKSHKFITLSQLQLEDHADVFDAIRSVNEWSVDKQEEYVLIYGQFANKLSELTSGLILEPFDIDRSLTSKRRLPFETYIKILKHLSERERILTKIFYLGGSRSLEEVLSLKIEDIDFTNHTLYISEEPIVYPKHVFHDLKYFIGRRTKGFVFTGRSGDKIDHTVPYRALKLIISKLDLDPAFTFKDFVKNV